MRRWAAHWMRLIADRLDPHGAPRATSLTFTFERGIGAQVRDDGRGCRLWCLNRDEYERAFIESDTRPPRIDWENMKIREYPTCDR